MCTGQGTPTGHGGRHTRQGGVLLPHTREGTMRLIVPCFSQRPERQRASLCPHSPKGLRDNGLRYAHLLPKNQGSMRLMPPSLHTHHGSMRLMPPSLPTHLVYPPLYTPYIPLLVYPPLYTLRFKPGIYHTLRFKPGYKPLF